MPVRRKVRKGGLRSCASRGCVKMRNDQPRRFLAGESHRQEREAVAGHGEHGAGFAFGIPIFNGRKIALVKICGAFQAALRVGTRS